MKRSLFVLTAVFVLAAGCQREKMAESGVDGSAVDVTFNIDLQGIGVYFRMIAISPSSPTFRIWEALPVD